MTTTVTIKAHCASDKEVKVCISDSKSGNVKEAFKLQDGEQADRVVYDDLELTVYESLKKA